MSLFDWLPFRKKKAAEVSPEEREALRRSFADRYAHFRRLLHANTRCHELMAEIEEALRGFSPYGMRHVRSLCMGMSTEIYQMIRNLEALAPGRHEALSEVYGDILERIKEHVEPRSVSLSDGPLVLDMAEVDRHYVDQCGAKMAMLGEAGKRLDLLVPQGFVMTTESFRRFLAAGSLGREIERLTHSVDMSDRSAVVSLASKLMQLVVEADLPDEVSTALFDRYDRLAESMGSSPKLAVRSSALGEDAEGTAFAGQYRTVLNVDRDSLAHAYKEVVASGFSRQAMSYRISRGLRDDEFAMGVGCMVMVDASAGGVAYSRDPVHATGDSVFVHSVWGLPKAVVDGSAENDEFIADREGRIRQQVVGSQKNKFVCRNGGDICREDLDGDGDEPSLDAGQVATIVRETVRLEEFFGIPQDVEWALTEDGIFHLLQCRPLLRLAGESVPRPEGLPVPLMSGGRTGSPGVGVGPVFLVRKDADTLTFPDGGVLVLKQPLPSRAALLDRCSALISEQGGVAGHLANVAREFHVPAVFGMRGALELLRTGRIVTVDADGGCVYDGPVEPLLQEPERQRVMRGSAVQAVLRDAARHIVRLNLTDPDAPGFRASECRTLHDIMRYCHEMAVREMFEFGTGDSVTQAASRQLICGVPRQFWILDLDDGIAPEADLRNDGCVLLEQVHSIPMRALWEGMQAVPWEGPPPVHAGGFMSVMFEATMNPDLVPATRSRFARKNYFMVSRNYCSLQSRFGFHLCGVESHVGERVSENYASFQFKGGAANQERRNLRARFVADFLERVDFRTRVRGDVMTARVEGLGREGMERRLKILGYLITHTRQLDMIMTNQGEVNRRREVFLKDIEQF